MERAATSKRSFILTTSSACLLRTMTSRLANFTGISTGPETSMATAGSHSQASCMRRLFLAHRRHLPWLA